MRANGPRPVSSHTSLPRFQVLTAMWSRILVFCCVIRYAVWWVLLSVQPVRHKLNDSYAAMFVTVDLETTACTACSHNTYVSLRFPYQISQVPMPHYLSPILQPHLCLKKPHQRLGLFRSSKKKVKIKFTLKQATKTQRGTRGIVLLFL
jgi:hypothetical protein